MVLLQSMESVGTSHHHQRATSQKPEKDGEAAEAIDDRRKPDVNRSTVKYKRYKEENI